MRIIFDTNILVSMVLSSSDLFTAIWRAWQDQRFEVVVCDQLLTEVTEVLARPKIERRLTSQDQQHLLQLLVFHTVRVDISEPYPPFDDENDRFLLALAEASNADVLLTGDKQLQALTTHLGTAILQPSTFLKHII